MKEKMGNKRYWGGIIIIRQCNVCFNNDEFWKKSRSRNNQTCETSEKIKGAKTNSYMNGRNCYRS